MYDIQQIMSFLPHRYPFILVDRVLELKAGEQIKALKNVTINEPYFQGHFPGTPIMPGVLIVEAMAQAGGVLVFASLDAEKHGSPVYFMGMDKVKFRQPVIPGDQLVLDVRILKQRARAVKMTATACVNEKCVAEAEIMAMIGDT